MLYFSDAPFQIKSTLLAYRTTFDGMGSMDGASSPYDFSKTIVENVKENGEKTQGTGENPF